MTSSAEPKPSARQPTLRDLQLWLQGIVSAHGGGVQEHLGDPAVQDACMARIRSRQGLDAVERVALYARGYLARLQECLRADYPAVRALVGDALFERFTSGYIHSCPPRDYSLFTLGADFASYLERTRPPERAVPAEQRSLLSLPVDLARVERARLEALRAPGSEQEATDRSAHLSELWSGAAIQVATPPCVRRVETCHDVRAFLAAVDRGERPKCPPVERVLLAISRVDYRPTVTPLREWQWMALECCIPSRSLPELALTLATRLGETEGVILADLSLWLPIGGTGTVFKTG